MLSDNELSRGGAGRCTEQPSGGKIRAEEELKDLITQAGMRTTDPADGHKRLQLQANDA